MNLLPLSWNLGFRRNLNVEIEEASNLLSRVESVVLLQNRCDRRVWSLDSLGVFSVKLLYSHLINIPSSLSPSSPFSVVWKAKVTPKVRLLAWLVVHGKINTCDLIQRRPISFFHLGGVLCVRMLMKL